MAAQKVHVIMFHFYRHSKKIIPERYLYPMTYVKTTLKREIEINAIITIHYFEYMKDFVFHGESHDFWEFLYVDKGRVMVQSGKDQHLLNAGDVIFHKPNEFHAIHSVGSSSPNLIAVSFVTSSPAMDFLIKKHYTLTMEERTLISHLINAARDCLSTPMHIPSVEQVQLKESAPFGSQQMILIYLELFLLNVIQNHSSSQAKPPLRHLNFLENAAPSKEKRLNSIIQYMQFHICERLTLPMICEKFSLSRSSLQSLFHKEKGCGAIEYFNNLKIQRAKDIIREGNMNFTEIAYYLSYSSLPYFSRCFKKSTGMSPAEYASSVKGISHALKNGHKRKEEIPGKL